jgi:Flp pilus assembly pilin Flp
VLSDESGQTASEYILLAALIAIVLVIVNKYFGNAIKNVFVKARESLSETNGFYFQVED